jgi:hypothetical protein
MTTQDTSARAITTSLTLAPKAGRVRHLRTKKRLLAPRPKPAKTREKTGSTPKRPSTKLGFKKL